jgi:hypothetical protein
MEAANESASSPALHFKSSSRQTSEWGTTSRRSTRRTPRLRRWHPPHKRSNDSLLPGLGTLRRWWSGYGCSLKANGPRGLCSTPAVPSIIEDEVARAAGLRQIEDRPINRIGTAAKCRHRERLLANLVQWTDAAGGHGRRPSVGVAVVVRLFHLPCGLAEVKCYDSRVTASVFAGHRHRVHRWMS